MKHTSNTQTTYSHNYKVGDILWSKWVYSMTISNFYQVIKITPKKIYIRELATEVADGDYMRGLSVPLRDVFPLDDIFIRTVHNDGGVDINGYHTAYMWDGKPKPHDRWD